MNEIIKKFWILEISFKSPLHIGKGSSDTFMGAAQIVQNGAGEYVIPGTSIAGCFFSTLQDCAVIDPANELGKELIHEANNDSNGSNASRLVFRTAVVKSKYNLVRDKVRINRKTKTAAEGAKFSQWEVMPQDMIIMLELDNVSRKDTLTGDQSNSIEKLIDTVLWSWHTEGFFIGGKSANGNGYAKLISARSCELNNTNFDAYLSSSYRDLPDTEMGWNIHEFHAPPAFNKAFRKRYKLAVNIGYKNPLLIKGGVCYISSENPDTDAAFIQREGVPFIPGSSIRGAISSFMDKYGKTEWNKLLGQENDLPRNEQHGGYVIFTDLLMHKEGKLLQIERHAEDQFSRAIYGSGKFDEERLFDADFYGEIFVLSGVPLPDNELDNLFAFLKSGIDLNMISLGSGACYPNIILEDIS